MKIINEGLSIGDVIRGKNRDPWSYTYDQDNGNLLVIKTNNLNKPNSNWIDAKAVLSPEDYQTAVANVNKLKAEYDSKKETPAEPDKKKLEVPSDLKEASTQYKMQVRMLQALYTMLTGNPDASFGKYKSLINNDEQGAAKAWKKYCDTTLMPILKKQLEHGGPFIKSNAQQIVDMINGIYEWIKLKYHGNWSVEIINPINNTGKTDLASYKKYKTRIIWNYL